MCCNQLFGWFAFGFDILLNIHGYAYRNRWMARRNGTYQFSTTTKWHVCSLIVRFGSQTNEIDTENWAYPLRCTLSECVLFIFMANFSINRKRDQTLKYRHTSDCYKRMFRRIYFVCLLVNVAAFRLQHILCNVAWKNIPLDLCNWNGTLLACLCKLLSAQQRMRPISIIYWNRSISKVDFVECVALGIKHFLICFVCRSKVPIFHERNRLRNYEGFHTSFSFLLLYRIDRRHDGDMSYRKKCTNTTWFWSISLLWLIFYEEIMKDFAHEIRFALVETHVFISMKTTTQLHRHKITEAGTHSIQFTAKNQLYCFHTFKHFCEFVFVFAIYIKLPFDFFK